MLSASDAARSAGFTDELDQASAREAAVFLTKIETLIGLIQSDQSARLATLEFNNRERSSVCNNCGQACTAK